MQRIERRDRHDRHGPTGHRGPRGCVLPFPGCHHLDSIHPWRPFVYVPRAWEIDALIQKVLGREMFARITLK
jgi:hypothetical protein